MPNTNSSAILAKTPSHFYNSDMGDQDRGYKLLFSNKEMERSRAPAELVEQIAKLGSVLELENSAHLRRAFTVYLTKVLLPRKTGRSDIPDLPDLLEVERMITETKPDWAEAWLKEGEMLGEKRGIKLGLVRGVQQTKRDTALRMIRRGMSVSEVAELVDLPEDEVRLLAGQAIN